MNKDSRILIGKVSGCFGVKGWLKIFSYSDPRENITTYKNWLIDGKLYESVVSKKQGKLIVAKLEGIDDKDSAMAFMGKSIEIEPHQLQDLDEGEYYWRDLIGLRVKNLRDIDFGEVTNLLETGAHDVIIVKHKELQRERLIPFVYDDTIVKVDLENQTMTVDWHEDD